MTIAWRFVDICLVPLALAAAVVNVAVSRWPWRLPICMSVFDRLGVYPVRHHYYTPLTYPSDLRAPLDQERVIFGLDLNAEGQLALVAKFNYRDELLAVPRKPGALVFGYDNPYFGAGDAEFLYNMVRHFKPKRIVEIGSGQSTLMAQLAVRANRSADARYRCEQICVDPFEQPWLEQAGVTVHRSRIEDLPPSAVEVLEAGDILFIDSSHVIRPQGDVLHEYLSLLGRLRPGVVIHCHDIFTPRDYPAQWVLRNRWLWNEQYLLEAFLCFNREFRVIAAVNWLWHNHREALRDACPILFDKGGEPGSFWFVRAA